MTKADVISMSLSNAKDWKQKGQPVWVVRCLSNAIVNRLSLALAIGNGKDQVILALKEDGFVEELKWYCEELALVKAGVEAKKVPPSAIGGNYLSLVLHHIARLLQEPDEERLLLEIALGTDSMAISTKLWQEYAIGLRAIASGTHFKPKKLTKLKGQEPYWLPYLELEANVSIGQGIQDAVSIVEEAFQKRNSDKSITDDQYEIEGSGKLPIRWDFRKDCILSYL